MKDLSRYLIARFLVPLLSAALVFAPLAAAQNYAPVPYQPVFAQQELDQMLAPIALYPDALLSQILMAATYPVEVVEAARWSRDHPALNGDRAVIAAEPMDWDPSVKSLVAFPQILNMMDEKLNWTQRLGDAFLAQEPQVMDTVQNLRQKAYAAGNLRSTDQILVVPQAGVIAVEPMYPQVIYVPYYDSSLVYGPWWWPAYPPVYWAPWPGYHAPFGVAGGFAWGPGIGISVDFFFGAFDWHQRRVNVVRVNNYYYHHAVIANRQPNSAPVTRQVHAAPDAWRHDPVHRRDVSYREAGAGGEAKARASGRNRSAASAQASGVTTPARTYDGARRPVAPAVAMSPAAEPQMRAAPAANPPAHERPSGLTGHSAHPAPSAERVAAVTPSRAPVAVPRSAAAESAPRSDAPRTGSRQSHDGDGRRDGNHVIR